MPKETNQDMGTGSVKKLMVQMAVPAVVGQVINLLYNVVDRIYIGHIPEIGGAALTGVGLFTPILMLITAFAMLAGAGGAPRAAIAMGKGDRDTAEKIVANCFTVLLLLSVVLTGVFYGTLPTLVRLFGGSDVTLPYAVQYGRIYVLGSVFVLVVMGMNPFITTQGFAGTSMLTTVIGAVINIVLDPIFIFVFDMGVAGAAIATVLSQAVSAVWILRFLTGRKTILRLKARNMLLQGKIILPCLALGISNFVMVSTESILSVSFTSSLSRYGGDVAVGAMTVLTSVNQLITMPLQGICQGGQPLISYNYGAKKLERVKEAFFCQFLVCVGEHIARRSGDIRYNRLFLSGQQIQKRRFSGIRLSKNNCLDALLDHLTLIRRCQELFNLLFLLRNNHGQPLRVSVQTDVLRVIKRRLDKRDLINQLLANCPDRLFHRSAQLALGAF